MRSVPRMFFAACSAGVAAALAACADEAPLAPVEAVSVRSAVTVAASPSSPATVYVGDTVTASTALRGKIGWTVRSTAVLRLIGDGTVVAVGAGSDYVIARGQKGVDQGRRDSTLVTVQAAPTSPPGDTLSSDTTSTPEPGDTTTTPAPGDTTTTPPTTDPTAPTVRVGYYVAPSGSSSATGSYDSPWDLATAFNGASGRIQPGDTVWVRGGTYRGSFRNKNDGTVSAPVVFRQYPGERATIDGNLEVYGSYTTLWGLEVMNSNPGDYQGINVRAPGTKLINLVVHDAGKSGIGFWVEAPSSEVHGSIIYNNGTHENLDHGIYAMNRDGMKYITDNVVFNNLAYGIHVYGSTGQYIQNFVIDGNASFNNASISSNVTGKPNLFVGGAGIAASGITVTNNTLYFSTAGSSNGNLRLGYKDDVQNGSLLATHNYVAGPSEPLELRNWSPVTMNNNQLYDSSNLPTSGVRVVVRPNKYEAGRAHVIVNNWSKQGSVSADLSAVLRSGDRYEVRSVQDFYGAPVASGTYGGGAISIPMGTARPQAPIGRSTRTPPVTGPAFDVFVVTRVAN